MNQNRADGQTVAYLKLVCPDCGSPLEVQDQSHVFCTHCGQKFIIDEAEGLVMNLDVDYRDARETKNSLVVALIVLGVILSMAFVMILVVFGYNYEAIHSRLFSSDYNLFRRGEGVERNFCEDIFDKKYKEITEEEFASVRYLKYDVERLSGTNEKVHVIEYSFTDYQDCESEEAFLATIKRWTRQQSSTHDSYDRAMDFTMFTGLTRVAIGGYQDSIVEDSFTKEADIRYVTTYSENADAEYIRKRVDPLKVEVLEFTAWSNLDGVEYFPNLRKLTIEIWFGDKFDFSKIGNCKKLEKLVVTDSAKTYLGKEQIGELTELKSLSLENMYLKNCRFISKLTNLEELIIKIDEENPQTQVIGDLPNLKHLYLLGDNNGYIPAGDIHYFRGVEVLKLAVNELTAVEELAKLESLKVLDVYMEVPCNDTEAWDKEAILDMSLLATLPDLEYLYMQPQPDWYSDELYVYGLEDVLNHPKVKGVYINEQLRPFESTLDEKAICRIDVDLFENNERLKNLQFRDCIFEDMETESGIKPDFIKHYTNLEYLVMDGCGIADLLFVGEIPGLKYCSFVGNEIEDFAPLKQCKLLEVAALYGNPNTNPELSKEVVVLQGGPEGVNLTEYLSGVEREVGYIKPPSD